MHEIQEIEARLAAATPGPWSRSGYDVGQVVYGPGGQPDLIGPISTNSDIEDAEFIAHAPEDMKLLLDILEDYSDFVAELVEENHTLKYQLEQIKVAISNHPNPCSKHPEDDPVSCGWKSAYIDIVETLAC